MLVETVNRKNIERHLFEYQLEMVDKKLIDTLDDDNWRFNWTFTRNQYIQFKSYAIPLLKKTFKCRKSRAEEAFEFFYKSLGLRIKN